MVVKTRKIKSRSTAPSPPASFCGWAKYATTFNDWDSVVQDPVAQTVTINRAGTGFNFCSLQGLNTWQTSTGIISFENTIQQNGGLFAGSLWEVNYEIFDFIQNQVVCGVNATSQGGGELRDSVSGTPIGSIVAADGYICGLTFDQNGAGSGTLYDNQGNSGAATINPAYDPANSLKSRLFVSSFGNAVTDLIISPNTKSRAFDLPESTGNGYCDYQPLPGQFCLPADLLISQNPSPNDQIMTLTGPNELTVETESLGNTGVQAAVFGAGQDFQTSTLEVKHEFTLTKNTTTAATENSQFGAYFFDFLAGPICGVFASPATGDIIDLITGLPIATGQTINVGYIVSTYIDPAGTARIRDTLANDTAIAVSPSYNNANAITPVAGIQAGSNIGEELDGDVNMGSYAFQWEDANRWCDT